MSASSWEKNERLKPCTDRPARTMSGGSKRGMRRSLAAMRAQAKGLMRSEEGRLVWKPYTTRWPDCANARYEAARVATPLASKTAAKPPDAARAAASQRSSEDLSITTCAPSARQAATLCAAPTTATTGSAPRARAICTSMEPTPPAAECTSTALLVVIGAFGQKPARARACRAVPATEGTAAASAMLSLPGRLRACLPGTRSREL
mmetsp:Transcript_26406/g.88467  ORF Transcript_26406/g.88467 Transcript_26406/m.88467 type:complete len:206 (-) Transcript_26406:1691-2308(-)